MKLAKTCLIALIFFIADLCIVYSSADYSLSSEKPSWVISLEIPESIPQPAKAYRMDCRYILIDQQVKASGTNVERFKHAAYQLSSIAGVHDKSELKFQFDPSYEHLTIHSIKIHRNGQRIDVLKPDELRLIQQERDLQRQVYNGTLSVLVFIPNVRVDDVIEYSYTIKGSNPVLNDHFTTTFDLALSYPIMQIHHRLLWSGERSLAIRNHRSNIQPVRKENKGYQEYIWNLKNVEAIQSEDYIPEWFDPYPFVSVSDFTSWKDVVDWALPLYVTNQELPEELQTILSQWRHECKTPVELLLTAVKFVQDEIRYLGIEVGPHGLAPHDPATVYERRFGDCKDKSLLCVAILRKLGIEAYPALVHTRKKHLVNNEIPAPTAFNHIIVQVQLEATTYWFDVTESYQRGQLPHRLAPDFKKALVIRPGSHNISLIISPFPDDPDKYVLEKFTVKQDTSPVMLRVKSHYSGVRAANLRYQFATQGMKAIEKDCLNFYARQDPNIEVHSPLKISDDGDYNIFTTEEQYRISDFWNDESHEFQAWAIRSVLDKPSITKRTSPYAVHFPTYIRQKIKIEFPEEYEIENWKDDVKTSALDFRVNVSYKNKTAVITYELKILKDHITPQEINDYVQAVDEINNLCYYTIYPSPSPWLSLKRWFLIIIAILAIPVCWSLIKALTLKTTTGQEGIIGEVGTVKNMVTRTNGEVFVHGERWQALTEDDQNIETEEKIVVTQINGLVLKVTKIEKDIK